TMVVAAGILAVAAGYGVKATAQTGQSPEPIAALLAEVHALRIAMEQSATVAPRVQLTLARLNIEEQRITQLAAQLDQVRRELTGATSGSKMMADRLTDLERSIQMAPDDKTRKDLESEQVQVKRQQAMEAVHEQ